MSASTSAPRGGAGATAAAPAARAYLKPPLDGRTAELVVLTKTGASTGVRLAFPLGKPALVGRAPRSAARLRARGPAAHRPALALDNATVSAAHAVLHVATGGGGASVADGGGRNGTWVVRRQGAHRGVARRVPARGVARLGHGDEVLFGGVRTRLEVSGGTRTAPAAVAPAPRGGGGGGGGGAPPAAPAPPPSSSSAPAPLLPRTPATAPPMHIVRLSSAVAADPGARAAAAAGGLTIAPAAGPAAAAWGVLVAAPPGARGGGFTRSLNWLLALAGGRPVAAPGWLRACADAGRPLLPVPPRFLITADPPAEAAAGFCLASALAASARAPLLLVRIVAASPTLLAAEADGGAGLVALVAAAGGTLAAAPPPPSRGASVARSVAWLGIAAAASPGERAWAARALPAGARVLSRAQFVEALLRQELPSACLFLAGK